MNGAIAITSDISIWDLKEIKEMTIKTERNSMVCQLKILPVSLKLSISHINKNLGTLSSIITRKRYQFFLLLPLNSDTLMTKQANIKTQILFI